MGVGGGGCLGSAFGFVMGGVLAAGACVYFYSVEMQDKETILHSEVLHRNEVLMAAETARKEARDFRQMADAMEKQNAVLAETLNASKERNTMLEQKQEGLLIPWEYTEHLFFGINEWAYTTHFPPVAGERTAKLLQLTENETMRVNAVLAKAWNKLLLLEAEKVTVKNITPDSLQLVVEAFPEAGEEVHKELRQALTVCLGAHRMKLWDILTRNSFRESFFSFGATEMTLTIKHKANGRYETKEERSKPGGHRLSSSSGWRGRHNFGNYWRFCMHFPTAFHEHLDEPPAWVEPLLENPNPDAAEKTPAPAATDAEDTEIF